MANGRAWRMMMNGQERASYLMGYIDTVNAMTMMNHVTKGGDSIADMHDWYAFGFIVGDYLKELNLLYSNTENVRIPIPFALRFCSAKLNCKVKKAELEQQLIDLRQLAARWAEW
jgi:hypothetical protein